MSVTTNANDTTRAATRNTIQRALVLEAVRSLHNHPTSADVYEVVRERRAVSTEMAMRLSRLFGTSAEYWLNLQRNVDLWESLDLHREELDAIEALIA